MTVQRTILTLTFALLMFCSTAEFSQAAQAGFSWLPNNEPTVTGYKIHYGTASLNYTFVIDVGLPEVIDGRVQTKIDGLEEGQTYYFAATAYSDTTESDYSTELEYTVPLPAISTPPIAHDLTFQINENTPLSNQLKADNPDGTSLQFTVTAQPGHGILTVEEASGSFTYTPTPGYFGSDQFSYTALNSGGVSNNAKVTLTIIADETDTDGDGISDGEEYNYWLAVGLSPETDSDGDGLPNLLDADSDNDGTNDGAEINAGFDPADATSFPPIRFEVGEVTLDNTLIRINFSSPFIQPVIIANTTTRNGTDPSVVRISGVDSEGFNVQVQEYDYLDGWHTMETMNYIVIEKGGHMLDDGTRIEAGLFETNATTPVGHPLANEFAVAPVVFTSVVTNNGPETVVGRVRNVSTTGFAYQLQEQEANDQIHVSETVAYLAWTPGSGISNGLRFQAGNTPDKVTQKTFAINFEQQFNDLPFQFVGMQTTDGSDTALVKIVEAGRTGMKIMVEEEGSKNSETSHTAEVAGFLTLHFGIIETHAAS